MPCPARWRMDSNHRTVRHLLVETLAAFGRGSNLARRLDAIDFREPLGPW